MEQNKIYLEKRDCFQYPDPGDYYSPHIFYPEYPFSKETLSSQINEVYDMTRFSLYGLGLDQSNFGKVDWNPLGAYVEKNAHIVIKPNFVNHINEIGGLDCTVTHPSILRCIIDYCVVAGASLIEVADAPIQNCNFEKLMSEHGYNQIFDYFRKKNINIQIRDLRMTKTKVLSNKIFLQEKNMDNNNETCEFDLRELSFFNILSGKQRYGIANYYENTVNEKHNDGHHKYKIAKSILEADLLINLPKPKTHRFAGITGAQKNFIGICSDKEYLPHFRSGTPENGGDETDKHTILNILLSEINRQRCKHIEKKNQGMQLFYINLSKIIRKISKILFPAKQEYSGGQWYGNDTIWRTTLDLNMIVLYGDSNGRLNTSRVSRNVLNIGDLIIAGENNGPLKPSSKKIGIILASNNSTIFDYVFCKITGFDHSLIPTVVNSINSHYLLGDSLDKIKLYSNINELNNMPLSSELKIPQEWNFVPHPFWNKVLRA